MNKKAFWVSALIVLTGLLCLLFVTDRQNSSVQAPITPAPKTLPDRPVATKPATPEKPATIQASVVFMGDTMLARKVGRQIVAGSDPFAYVTKTLQAYDLRVANIETTIANPALARRASGKLYTFNAPLESIKTLQQARLTAASLANNHTSDFGPAATSDMVNRFKKAAIVPFGAGNNTKQAFEPQIIAANNITVALVGLNDVENSFTRATASRAGSAYFDRALVKQSIASAREVADVVVVVPHWGTEYQTSANARQKEWGHFFIDAGADAVVGGHAHVIQPTETYQGKPIVYSMGNFIFDGMSGNALDGQMIGLTITKTGNKTTVSAPKSIRYRIDSNGFPRLSK